MNQRQAKYVVHCKRTAYDVYIGRPPDYGNPFSHKTGTAAKFTVSSRDDAVDSFAKWIHSDINMMKLVRRELSGGPLRPATRNELKLLSHMVVDFRQIIYDALKEEFGRNQAIDTCQSMCRYIQSALESSGLSMFIGDVGWGPITEQDFDKLLRTT